MFLLGDEKKLNSLAHDKIPVMSFWCDIYNDDDNDDDSRKFVKNVDRQFAFLNKPDFSLAVSSQSKLERILWQVKKW